jgi:hypothetical protein
VQTALGGALVFVVLVPLILQLLVVGFGDLVGLFAAQGAADHYRKHPDDPAAAEARARRVVEAFGGSAFVRGMDVELFISEGRATAVVRAHVRPVIPGVAVPLRSRAAGSVEGFRPDREPEP